MAITIHDTATLMAVQNNQKPVSSYWLDLLFPMVQTFDTESIDFDIIEGGARIAPFVSPTAQGVVLKNEGFNTRRFKPAYLKPKHVVKPNAQLKRIAGEAYGGAISPEARINAAIASNLMKEKDLILRRLEVMACEAVLTGKNTVTGENYPTQIVDFQRDANQYIDATATPWSNVSHDIVSDLDEWCNQTQLLSGYAPSRVTVTPDVWSHMRKNTSVEKSRDTTYAGNSSALDSGVGNGEKVQYKGMLGTSLEVHVYNDIYENDSGVNVPLMGAGQVVLTSSGVEGVRCFGAIQDAEVMMPMEMYPKMWLNPDPSVVYTMTQSAPLMVPTRPNATLVAKVL